MADLLRFKKGEHKNLPAVSADTVGTVYVTVDEQAMYVDVAADKRIRLGQIVTFATLTEFQAFLNNTIPPYSEEAFYYIDDKNALLKWVSDSGNTDIGASSTKGTWKQINTTSQVEADLSALKARVSTNETNIAGLRTDLGTKTDASSVDSAFGRIKKIREELDTANTGIKARLTATENVANAAKTAIGSTSDDANASGSIYARIKKNAADISSVTTRVGTLETNVSGLGTRLTNVETKNTNQDTKIQTLETNLGNPGDASTATSAFGRIKKLEETDASYGTRLTAVETKANTNATNIGTNSTNIANLTTLIGTSTDAATGTTVFAHINDHEQRIEALEETTEDLGDRTQTLETKVGNLQTGLNNANTTIGQQGTAISGLQTDLSNLSTTVAGHTTTLGQHTTSINKNASDITALQTRAGNIESAATALTARVKTNEDAISGLKTRMGTAETNITSLQNNSATKTELQQAKTDLNNSINNKVNAVNAMRYIKGVSKYSDLPTITQGVSVGDTFVVLVGFTQSNVTYTAGDLIVASGTEDATTGKITSNLSWDHVETGYIEAHEATLDAASNTIRLTSFNAGANEKGNLGKVTIKAKAGSAVTVATANNEITVGVEWGSF